ncbi:MAG: Membrane-associated zinc metalloprotease [uncultured bacterium]|nr:MAG: Membrane-associated zinc metalloprotease [uncultured bacterium]KKT89347.1 MAG: Membrane-associated zinc metalloprotease [Candidatus Moranbacteria bacterium GW2011_GWC2_45_10]KKT95552.1 MAG: Membrane-associated zinc metalloprotease [Parcubacteria group bacterium GW2011_GWC1_45_14]HAV11041.1 RIP metalloprotease RseP [Candidatus Moranbacteria bacterium]
MAILIFILILGVLVLIHELGHFVVAKRNGITAHEFGFGFPPRVFGVYKSDKGKWKFVRGSKDVETKNTIYSLNWFPIGGFVKIKGEDGSGQNEKDSFANKSAWTRIKVLLAGVIMNFVLAWVFFSAGFMIGTYQEVVDGNTQDSKILINMVAEGSPAEQMGIRLGDELVSGGNGGEVVFGNVKDVQDFINNHKGEEIALTVLRGEENLELRGTPRTETVESQGSLGIGLAEVRKVRYGFFQSLYYGLLEMKNVFILMLITIKELFVGKTGGVDVTGIIGIAVYTGQIIPLGIVQILRFAAILSINLGIINALPFPALDGGRVLFILIEKIKGSPVSEKVEQAFHTVGFMLLIILMVVVTFKDFIRFDIVDKIKGVF